MVPTDLNIDFQGLALIHGQIYNPVYIINSPSSFWGGQYRCLWLSGWFQQSSMAWSVACGDVVRSASYTLLVWRKRYKGARTPANWWKREGGDVFCTCFPICLKVKMWTMTLGGLAKLGLELVMVDMGVSKNRVFSPKMDGLFHGKPYSNWWLGGTIIFGNTHIVYCLIGMSFLIGVMGMHPAFKLVMLGMTSHPCLTCPF